MKLSDFLMRWTPTFLAFPLAGVASKIAFGSANSVVRSTGGGLIVGLVVGLIQFYVLKKFGISVIWVLATAVAVMLAALVNSLIFSFKFNSESLTGMGLVAGLLVGFAQAFSQSRDVKFVLVWTIATSFAWAFAWLITSKVIVDPEAQYHIFGSSGALVATVLLGICFKFIAQYK
jgi:hypothetical protein